MRTSPSAEGPVCGLLLGHLSPWSRCLSSIPTGRSLWVPVDILSRPPCGHISHHLQRALSNQEVESLGPLPLESLPHGSLSDSSARSFCSNPWCWGTWGLRALGSQVLLSGSWSEGQSQWEGRGEGGSSTSGGSLAFGPEPEQPWQVQEPHELTGSHRLRFQGAQHSLHTFWKLHNPLSTPFLTSLSAQDFPEP